MPIVGLYNDSIIASIRIIRKNNSTELDPRADGGTAEPYLLAINMLGMHLNVLVGRRPTL